MIDYHAEILRCRPTDWDWATNQFRQYQGYDVPTLIARDGVHPSNPQEYANDYSDERLRNNGFALRSYLALLKYAEVIEWVLPKKPASRDAPRRTIFFQDFEGQGDWDGTVTGEGTPAANQHAVEGQGGDPTTAGRSASAPASRPPPWPPAPT